MLKETELLRRVNALRKTDNWRNLFYLAGEYLFLGLMVGLTITFYHVRVAQGWSWWWNVPVTFLAVVLIGAGQHRLTTMAHEASHYLLFRNRLFNELASDWLCMFPMWSTTHYYRLQHMAHHQYPNDPERDPDVTQMEGSGHRFHFPMSPGRFLWQCVLRQALWLPGLVRYVRMRAHYAMAGGGARPEEERLAYPRLLLALGGVYTVGLAAALTALCVWDMPVALAVVPLCLWAAAAAFYALIPTHFYRRMRIRPDVSLRWTTLGRLTYVTGLFSLLAWLSYWTGSPWGWYYLLLWMLPMATSFGFCMIARQVVQHGHAGNERFSNTRVFLVGRLIRWAVFPLGMHYHLPHHLFPLVPHYRLGQLHELLLRESEDYGQNCIVVEGYFFHRRPPKNPTVLELMAKSQASPTWGRAAAL
jgi:fatty acid desaturase